MAKRRRPEDDRHAAFYDGAPSDYFTTSVTPGRSAFRDILAEETNERARSGNVDTADFEPEPDPKIPGVNEPYPDPDRDPINSGMGGAEESRRMGDERWKEGVEMESEALKAKSKEYQKRFDSKDFKEWKPVKMKKAKPKKKVKPKSDKTPIRKPLKKKKTETQMAKAEPPRAEKIRKKEKSSKKKYKSKPRTWNKFTPKEKMEWNKKFFFQV
tara:strand:+ start:242 stop:880 length:639 start_codon:yes stop_codon:yes gene_type:complete